MRRLVTPRWMKHILDHSTGELHEQVVERCESFGRHIFGTQTAEEAIQAIYDFYKEVGVPITLPEVGINESRIDEMAHHVATLEGLDRAWVPLHEADIAAIYRACLK